MPEAENTCFIVKKGNKDKVETKLELPDTVGAPIKQGEPLGEVIFTIDGEEVARRPIVARESVERINLLQMYVRMLGKWVQL
jgi:D-alanyl-D-alanine carboxypeptidase (penicillin-binding protein 5/6)